MKTNLPFFIFYYGFGKRKTKGRYIQHNVLFRFSFFHLAKEKNENMYNGSYFYFSFFVCGLRKKERILRFPFPIFYHEIEKRKTKGRYIHGPSSPYCNIAKYKLSIHVQLVKRSWEIMVNIIIIITISVIIICLHQSAHNKNNPIISSVFMIFTVVSTVIRAPSQYKDRLIYVWRFPC